MIILQTDLMEIGLFSIVNRLTQMFQLYKNNSFNYCFFFKPKHRILFFFHEFEKYSFEKYRSNTKTDVGRTYNCFVSIFCQIICKVVLPGRGLDGSVGHKCIFLFIKGSQQCLRVWVISLGTFEIWALLG